MTRDDPASRVSRAWSYAAIGTAILFGTAGTFAQDRTAPPGGQIVDKPHDVHRDVSDTTMPQLSQDRGQIPTVARSERAAPLNGAMQSVPADRAVPLTQITTSSSHSPQASQASHGDRSVQPGERLTAAGESRNVRVPRITGADRCDPQSQARAASSVCQQVIEARADSFATERPDLSPEERLLAERYTPRQERGVLAEVQRVGRNDVDPASIDTQALATVVLGQPVSDPIPAEDTKAGDPVIVNDLLNAVIDQMTANPG
ncbi:hypothetical protein [Sphingomonas carotinifaciens]|uniref:Uncharacterized protein n=1 Tax=Sphingomonas carotinifaciens TaxID=1166323 RepID=A0A1G7QW02_9SPHN|nr:hypothetical protein [Sphingomonas carotinifaciens]MBB4087882.1 hypothetical protein [Sphingomonas carotinifaciens]MWC42374.1 hypothetical protein [Sphingomonas carotinifaciens]SDG02687.1 hypothetical protein SAMN05216557_10966 [Sphingomonas carotinifaciens]